LRQQAQLLQGLFSLFGGGWLGEKKALPEFAV
jgi:hypothetical protein